MDAFTVPTLVVVSAALVHCNIPLTNEIPTKPWEIISVDMIGPLPESNSFDAILIFVD